MHSNSFRIHIVVILFYAGLTVLFLNPLSWRMVGAVTDTVDPLLNTWIASWDVHALLTAPAHLFDANIFYAYPDALAYSETLLGSALLVFPFAVAFNLPVVSYNLILFTGFVLGGYHAYLLGRVVTRSHLAAFLVGVIFVFNAYRLSMLPKVQMLTLQWLPLVVYYLWRITRRARWQDALILALFLVMQVVTTVYYGVFTALMLLILTPFFLMADYKQWWKKVAILALAALISLIIVLPYAWVYFRVSGLFGLGRALTDAIPFSASLAQWAMVSTENLFYGHWLGADSPPMVGPYPVDFLFPGLITLILSAAGLLCFRRRWRWELAILVFSAVAFVLSLGPVLMLHPLQPPTVDPIILPYAWLHQHLPGFKALRAPARFAGFVMLGLGVFAGIALAAMQRRGINTWALIGLIALVFLESLSWPATSVASVPQGDAIPPVYRWLQKQPPGVVVDLPAALPQQQRLPERWLWPQYFSIYHWNKTPTGYSGFVPPHHESLIELLNHFPNEEILMLYRAMDVRYVILHRHYYQGENWKHMLAKIEAQPDLRIAWQDADVVVVTQSPASAGYGAHGGELVLPSATSASTAFSPLLILDLDSTTSALPPGYPATGTIEWTQSGRVIQHQGFAEVLPFLARTRTAVNLHLLPPAPGDYLVHIVITSPITLSASGPVLVSDAAPSEQLLPLQLTAVTTSCGADGRLSAQLEWMPWGWVDAPLTVYLHLLDEEGQRLTQLDALLSPSPDQWLPQHPVQTTHRLASPEDDGRILRVGLYIWSDRYQTIIPARFFDKSGSLVEAVEVLIPADECAQRQATVAPTS